MRRLLPLLFALLPISALAKPSMLPQLVVPPVQTGAWLHSEQKDWLPGSFTNTFVDGSVLRLQDGQPTGTYTAFPLQAPFGFNAGIARWAAQVGPDQSLTVEVRSSIDAQTWSEWRSITPVAQQDNKSISQLLVFPLFTSWLQYRITFSGQTSPSLDEIELTYISSTAGPSLADVVGRVPLVGPSTLTPTPEAIARAEWTGESAPANGERQVPQTVELAQVPIAVDDPNPLATLRALRWVSQNVLGQTDVPYHYLIDGQGNIYEGRGSVTLRIPEVASGTVRIGVLGNADVEGVSEAAQAKLIEVLAWLHASYRVPLTEVTAAAGAPERLAALTTELQPAIQRAVVRSRTLFAEGRTMDATERVALFNPTRVEAQVVVGAYSAGGESRRSVVVPPGQRIDVTLNETLPQTTSLGLDIQADRPLLSERTLIIGNELLSSTGAAEPARTWYFAEGTTISNTETTVAVVNPQRQEVTATITFYPDGAVPLTRTTTFAPRSRATLRLSELLPDSTFGFKLVASQPVVVERAVVLETGAAHLATGSAELSRRWSFAEGSTTEGFTTTLQLLNPWQQQLAVTLQVMSEDGTSLSRRYAVQPQARLVLVLNEIVPVLPFAMTVEAERPVVAERTMRIAGGGAATATVGAPRLTTRWTFVEGSTAAPAEQFLLIANANRTVTELDVQYILLNGNVERRSYSVPAMARFTISANADVPDQPVVTTVVTANRPIVAERSIFVTGPDGGIGAETSVGIPSR